jgi:hypothetical protein
MMRLAPWGATEGQQAKAFGGFGDAKFHDGTSVTPRDVKWSVGNYRGAWGKGCDGAKARMVAGFELR